MELGKDLGEDMPSIPMVSICRICRSGTRSWDKKGGRSHLFPLIVCLRQVSNAAPPEKGTISSFARKEKQYSSIARTDCESRDLVKKKTFFK
jgi:hypothetical protein